MIDLNAVSAFVAVADAGTFSGGAEVLGIPKGSISRKVSGLETSLGVRLFHRTTRKVTLTDIGQTYYQHCRLGLDELSAANQLISESVATPKGILRIAAPAAFGGGVFTQWIATYMELYPETRVELLLSDAFVDLVENRIDLAFRFGQLNDSTLIARKLSSTRRIICANPAYLKEHGMPNDHMDLLRYDAIVHSASLTDDSWQLVNPEGNEVRAHIKPRLAGQSINMVRDAAVSGLGIALLPEQAIQTDLINGKLEQILDGYATPSQGLYAVYPSSRQLSINVKAFMELVNEKELMQS